MALRKKMRTQRQQETAQTRKLAVAPLQLAAAQHRQPVTPLQPRRSAAAPPHQAAAQTRKQAVVPPQQAAVQHRQPATLLQRTSPQSGETVRP